VRILILTYSFNDTTYCKTCSVESDERMSMHDEMGRTGEEAVVAHFKVISRHSDGIREKYYKTQSCMRLCEFIFHRELLILRVS